MKPKVLILIALVAIGVIASIYVLKNDAGNQDMPESKNCITYNGTIVEQCAGDYINLPVEEAARIAEENGLIPKVVVRDGEGQITTDEGSTPIFLEVENNIVTEAYFEHNR